MHEPLLCLEGIHLQSPDGRSVFRNLDWRLERGARFHIREGLGGGASAFLRLCCGLAQPHSGKALLDGISLAGPHPFLERGALGYVPSDGGLAVNLSLQDNIALPLRFALNQDRKSARTAALLWLERAGLKELAQQRPHLPADGQSWLASLARAAAKGSELWLVDRPAGGLGPHAVQSALELLRKAGEDPGVTMVLVGGGWMAQLGSELRLENGQVATGRQS